MSYSQGGQEPRCYRENDKKAHECHHNDRNDANCSGRVAALRKQVLQGNYCSDGTVVACIDSLTGHGLRLLCTRGTAAYIFQNVRHMITVGNSCLSCVMITVVKYWIP